MVKEVRNDLAKNLLTFALILSKTQVTRVSTVFLAVALRAQFIKEFFEFNFPVHHLIELPYRKLTFVSLAEVLSILKQFSLC